MPAHEEQPPEAVPERRSSDRAPATLIMQGYEKMGPKGRRRLMWIGLAMLTAAGGVGLFADEPLGFYRFIIVLVFLGLGSGFVFPQYGIMFVEKVLAPIISKRLLSRPDRRNNDEEE